MRPAVSPSREDDVVLIGAAVCVFAMVAVIVGTVLGIRAER